MTLTAGARLGPYEIQAPLGAGGMGEVYRARDTRLGRDVAIKVLPEALAADPERMARFEREAQLLASLNHPNIASVYGLEHEADVRALVMELVEGPSLAGHIESGPIPIEESIRIARQIAEALEAAHGRGVIHRDLKPANVLLGAGVTAKVLDFGLAKSLERESGIASDLSRSPTISLAATRAGVILGTAPYMSPEQARGRPADRRSDIWAFGCVLYELLSGRQAFTGDSASDVLASVLKSEPDWSALPAETPPRLRRLLRRCLAKEPKQRLHDIADVRLELEDASEEPNLPRARERSSSTVAWAVAAALAVAVSLLAWRLVSSGATAVQSPIRFSVAAPAELVDEWPNIAVSPDGKRLVFAAGIGDEARLYARPFDQLATVSIPGTEGARNPYFSPDGQWVAFTAGRKLKKVSVAGGAPLALCDAEWGGGDWGPSGIVFTTSYTAGLSRILESGGKPEMLTTPDHAAGELGHWWPQVLPGGKATLFTAFSTPIARSKIMLLLQNGGRRLLLEGGTFARYVDTGHILFVRSQTLEAVPFDLGRLEITGAPFPVLEDVPLYLSNGNSNFSASSNGTLAYVPASSLNTGRRLAWVDRKGAVTPVNDALRRYSEVQLSPDGQRAALTITAESRDIWIQDLLRGTSTRVTFGAASEFSSVWTPDGRRLVFASERPVFEMFWKNASGTGTEEPIAKAKYDRLPGAVSPDGRLVVFREGHPETGGDLWMAPLDGKGEPKALIATPYEETSPRLSSDGHWLAYVSNESGRDEVYVTPFPDCSERVQISTEGGEMPAWRRDGRELFYRRVGAVIAVSVEPGTSFRAGAPRLLFQGEFSSSYDVAADGQRFLMIQRPAELAPRQIDVVTHWFEELRRAAGSRR